MAPKTIRKGQHFRRKSDGFVFVAVSASRAVPGAMLQCVDAARIFGWYDARSIEMRFERVAAPKEVPS